jgi:hypothetical protein
MGCVWVSGLHVSNYGSLHSTPAVQSQPQMAQQLPPWQVAMAAAQTIAPDRGQVSETVGAGMMAHQTP